MIVNLRRYRSGFTLIEMAVVLVVLALVTGTILVASDMIQTAALRRDLTQLERLNTAANAFKLKYGCVPGDCDSVHSGGAFGAGIGNGDGRITGLEVAGEYLSTIDFWGTEQAYFYAQLAIAEFIPIGRFDPNSASSMPVEQAMMPLASRRGLIVTSCAIDLARHVGGCHYYRMGLTPDRGSNRAGSAPALFSAAEAFYFDAKIDNAAPFTGGVVSAANVPWDQEGSFALSGSGPSGTCVIARHMDVAYNIGAPEKLCGLLVKAAF